MWNLLTKELTFGATLFVGALFAIYWLFGFFVAGGQTLAINDCQSEIVQQLKNGNAKICAALAHHR